MKNKIKELEERIKLLESTSVCSECGGNGKKSWLSIGGGLNTMTCWKCGGEGRIKIKK